jgi:hypothetical protein
MSETFRIDEAQSGFPGIAHGGYLCGILARGATGPMEVTLRRPLATGTEATLDGNVVRDAAGIIAEMNPAKLALPAPEPVAWSVAERATRDYPGHRFHPFASCFACGPGRGDDGLRIFVGPVPGREVLAAPWVPPALHAGPDGALRSEVIWAALDCPAIWGLALQTRPGAPEQVVSGRIAVEIRGRVLAGRPHVVTAWPRGADGRKQYCAAAIWSADGELLALGAQTCIITERGVPIGRWGLRGAAT